jgi:hypothetical protein
MTNTEKQTIVSLLVFLLLLIFPALSISQEYIINLDLSRYNFRYDGQDDGVVDYDDNEHAGMFPNGSYYMWTVSNIKEHWLFGYVVLGAGEEQREYNRKISEGYFLEPPFGIKQISKYPRPRIFVDDIEVTPLSDVIVDPSIKADKMYEIYKKHSPWFHVRYRGYQFVNQLYGDFVIRETTYKLTYDDDQDPDTSPDIDADISKPVNDLYILKSYRIGQTSITGKTGMDPSGDWFIHHGAWWCSSMIVPSIVPGADRSSLVVTYSWDGDHPNLVTFSTGGPLFDDTGEPRFLPIADGVLVSTPYSGFTLLHCDRSPSDKSDWVADNPFGSYVRVNFANERGDALWPGNKSDWDYFITPGKQTTPEVSTLEAGTDPNPTTIEGKQPVQIWGGWPELLIHDSVTVVHAIGAGSISREEAREVGEAWAAWYKNGDSPEAYYNDPDLGNVLVTDQIKNQIVSRGKDSLTICMQRAQELWENDMICPRPFPSPDLYVNSGPYSITLEWSNVEEQYPDAELGQVRSYRVYRKVGHFEDENPLDAGKKLYWEMIGDLPVTDLEISSKGLFTYKDNGLKVGENYYYAVTAISNIHAGLDGSGPFLESSKWSNRSASPAIPFVPGKGHMDSVAVVPNPFYINAQLMNFASDNNRLMFANLPPYCKLRIYNVIGDLIHTINHDSGTSTAFWDQITSSNQFIASGVYILLVTDAQRLVADDEGNLTIRESFSGQSITKFVIIR